MKLDWFYLWFVLGLTLGAIEKSSVPNSVFRSLLSQNATFSGCYTYFLWLKLKTIPRKFLFWKKKKKFKLLQGVKIQWIDLQTNLLKKNFAQGCWWNVNPHSVNGRWPQMIWTVYQHHISVGISSYFFFIKTWQQLQQQLAHWQFFLFRFFWKGLFYIFSMKFFEIFLNSTNVWHIQFLFMKMYPSIKRWISKITFMLAINKLKMKIQWTGGIIR